MRYWSCLRSALRRSRHCCGGHRAPESQEPEMIPMEYRLASEAFDRFMAEVAEETGLTTRIQAYTTTEGVFRCFRRRLELGDAIAFAQVLPPLLGALFVQDWDTAEPRKDSWECAHMTAEVKQLRAHHNFSP